MTTTSTSAGCANAPPGSLWWAASVLTLLLDSQPSCDCSVYKGTRWHRPQLHEMWGGIQQLHTLTHVCTFRHTCTQAHSHPCAYPETYVHLHTHSLTCPHTLTCVHDSLAPTHMHTHTDPFVFPTHSLTELIGKVLYN
jgi:hypothetical protein